MYPKGLDKTRRPSSTLLEGTAEPPDILHLGLNAMHQYMVVFVGSIVRVASTSFRRTLHVVHIQVTSEFHMCNIFSLGVDSRAQEDQYRVPLYIHCLLHFPHPSNGRSRYFIRADFRKGAHAKYM